jgi:hypothetical protein
MFVRLILLLVCTMLLPVGSGCATCCGVVGCGPLLPGILPGPGTIVTPCGQPADSCSECEEICSTSACACPVPSWGPLTPLFAILCWGYPDAGCGEFYFGDWPMHPRGWEPCDSCGHWVGVVGEPMASAQVGLAKAGPPAEKGSHLIDVKAEGIQAKAGCSTCPPATAAVHSVPRRVMAKPIGIRAGQQSVSSSHRLPPQSAGLSTSTYPSPVPLQARTAGMGTRIRTELVACPQCGRPHITRPVVAP